ncbi:MAG: hypothetical protein HY892_03080 [Deltaproteobacteria bacterium]|nr:hypothetical protein [Deltaproteobacteria bacterium]
MRRNVILIAWGIIALIFSTIVFQTTALAQQTALAGQQGVVIKTYGPGGPAPAMREAAKVFGDRKAVRVEILAGPTPNWKDQALKDADLVFSGSEYMMTDFVRRDLPGLIDTATIRTLYLRPSAMLVRPAIPSRSEG